MNNETNPLSLQLEISRIVDAITNGFIHPLTAKQELYALQSQSLPAVEQPEKSLQEDCPKGCSGLTYSHDDRETKSCCACGHEWNRFDPQPSQPEGKTLEEPFGYVFENRFYKNLDQMSGQTFSEGDEPLTVYANQPCKELETGMVYYLCDFTAPKVFTGLVFECLLTDQRIPANAKIYRESGTHIQDWNITEIYKPERFGLPTPPQK